MTKVYIVTIGKSSPANFVRLASTSKRLREETSSHCITYWVSINLQVTDIWFSSRTLSVWAKRSMSSTSNTRKNTMWGEESIIKSLFQILRCPDNTRSSRCKISKCTSRTMTQNLERLLWFVKSKKFKQESFCPYKSSESVFSSSLRKFYLAALKLVRLSSVRSKHLRV